MSKAYFEFKQFKVYHDKCAMKVGTDGLLLGTLTDCNNAEQILDIGAGTGLIALILAQRSKAVIDAVEIDPDAAEQAKGNFEQSLWSDRLTCFHSSIFDFSPGKKYDLIVSNPPYFINSLRSDSHKKQTARHVDDDFFPSLTKKINGFLTDNGSCWIILPVTEMDHFINAAAANGLFPYQLISIHSFDHSIVKRKIVAFKKIVEEITTEKFVIYESQGKHSQQYIKVAKDFLTIF